jgi:hypothetical protein
MSSLRKILNFSSAIVVFGAAAFGSRPASAAQVPGEYTACCYEASSTCYVRMDDGTITMSPGSRAC